jgi:integrase
LVGDKYIGRYRVDAPGSTKQTKKAVIIGSIHEMTKPEADRKLLELIEREGVNTAVHLERSRRPAITFGQAARSWRDNHLSVNKKPASKKSMGSELRNHVLPHLETVPFDEVNTYATIRALVRKWQKAGLSTKSMKNIFTIIRAVYNFRLDEIAQAGAGSLGPWIIKWKRVKPVADIEEEQACFEEEQMFAIVNAAKTKRARAMYALFGGTGMRFGEVAALLVEDVRFCQDGTGVVTVRRSLSDDEICTTKSNRVRYVPIDATVVQELKKFLGDRRSGLFFPSRNGTPLRENNMLRDGLHPVLGKLKISRAGFHAFRHGRCSFLVRSDVPRAVIREWLGHASDSMIDRYSHRWGKHSRVEMQKLIPLMDSRNGLKEEQQVA